MERNGRADIQKTDGLIILFAQEITLDVINLTDEAQRQTVECADIAFAYYKLAAPS